MHEEPSLNPESQDDDTHWLWTVQLARHRLVKTLGIRLFDITVKSGIQAFSPTWDMLRAYKSGNMSETEYERLYIQKVKDTLETSPELWQEFKKEKNIAIGCYCTPGVFCHRLIFTNLLTQYLCSQGREVVNKGEIISAAQTNLGSIKSDESEPPDIPH